MPVSPPPAPPTNAEIDREGKRLLEKAFNRCPNASDLNVSYAFGYDEKDKKAYLLEVEDFSYEIVPRVPGVTPVERKEGLEWAGTFIVTAEITDKLDILNKKWAAVQGVGTQSRSQKLFDKFSISRWDFPLTKENGKWVCNECSKYTALDCNKVKILLEENPRNR